MSNNTSDCNGWSEKLVGKVIIKDNAQTDLAAHKFVREKDLPTCHRVLKKNSMMTMDFRPERLNIHVDDDGLIRSVNFDGGGSTGVFS